MGVLRWLVGGSADGTGDAPYDGDAPGDEATCTILASGFDYLIQFILGACCLGIIFSKWYWLDSTRRPLWIFLADLAKQGGGFFIAHVGNIVMSELLKSSASPCVWYFVNIFLDCTARVLMVYWCLRWLKAVIARWNLDPEGKIQFGVYGEAGDGECCPGEGYRKPILCCIVRQCAVWYAIVAFTRVVMGLLVWALEHQLSDLGTWVLGPLEDYTKRHGHDLELIVVMMVIPAVLIAFQLWVQDAFLQADGWSGGNPVLRYCPCVRFCGYSAPGGGDTPSSAPHASSQACADAPPADALSPAGHDTSIDQCEYASMGDG